MKYYNYREYFKIPDVSTLPSKRGIKINGRNLPEKNNRIIGNVHF